MITFDTSQITFDTNIVTFDGWTGVDALFTVTTDRTLFRQTLEDWLTTYAGIARMFWTKKKTPRPAKPYGTIFFPSGSIKSGFDEEIQSFNYPTQSVERLTHGPRLITVQVELYSKPAEIAHEAEAYEMRENALLALDTHAVRELFRAAKIGLISHTPVQRMDDQLGERWERRALAELTLSYSGETLHNGGSGVGNWIRTVEVPTDANGNAGYEE